MNDTDFKKSLREKAENYTMDAPEGLWDGIERKVKGRIFFRRFTRVTAAAAAVALLVVLGISLTRESIDTESLVAEIPAPESIETATSEPSSLLALTETEMAPEPARMMTEGVKGLDAERPEGKVRAVEAETAEESGEDWSENEEITSEENTENERFVHETPEEKNSENGKVSSRPERGQIVDDEYYRDAFREDDARRRHASEGVSVRLLAANSTSISLSMGRMMDEDMSSALQTAMDPGTNSSYNGTMIYSSDRMGDILIANLNEPVLNEEKHHRPLTFGVRAAYPLTDRIAIESGLNYSLLRSDFSYGGSKASEERKQTLHYLGIPLNLNYSLLHYRSLDFIISAGGMVEKCVYGKVVTDYTMDSYKSGDSKTLSVKGLQWSAGASASLQYNFAKNFGLFLEPGIRYRFENGRGRGVSSSYTDEPLDLSLAIGARVNL